MFEATKVNTNSFLLLLFFEDICWLLFSRSFTVNEMFSRFFSYKPKSQVLFDSSYNLQRRKETFFISLKDLSIHCYLSGLTTCLQT